MKTLFAVLLALTLGSAANAAAQDVRYNFDKDANFAGFKTYRWVVIKGATQLSTLVDGQVKACGRQLAKKGLTKTDPKRRTSQSATRPPSVRRRNTPPSIPDMATVPDGAAAGTGRWHVNDNGSDIHYLCWAARAGHVHDSGEGVGVARQREQDTRSEGQARQAEEEPRQGCGENVADYPPPPPKK